MTRHEGGYRRTRESVRRTRVKHIGVKNARIIIGISTGKLDQVARTRHASPIPADGSLHTARVELCPAQGRSEVESDDLVADEIVAWGDVRGDQDGGVAALEEVDLEPVWAVVGFTA